MLVCSKFVYCSVWGRLRGFWIKAVLVATMVGDTTQLGVKAKAEASSSSDLCSSLSKFLDHWDVGRFDSIIESMVQEFPRPV